MKLSDYVFRFISGWACGTFHAAGRRRHAFGGFAGALSRLEFICNLHEQAAAIAAEAYAKVTNNLGVALVTSGQGDQRRDGRRRGLLDSTPAVSLRAGKRADLKRNTGVRQLACRRSTSSDRRIHHQVCGDRDGAGEHPLPSGEGALSGEVRPAGPGVAGHPAGCAGRQYRPERAGIVLAAADQPDSPAFSSAIMRALAC